MNKLLALPLILLSLSLRPDLIFSEQNSQEVLRWAYAFDKVGELALRQSADGDYVSQFGTILDVSCFKGMDSDQRKKLEIQFEEDLTQLLQKTRACHEDYPEIGYLSEAISVLRRSVIVCENKKRDLENFLNVNLAYTHQFHFYNTPKRQGRSLYRPSHYKRLYYIVIPTNFSDFLLSFQEGRISTLFHEALHQTGADNRFDHAGIQWRPFIESNPCQFNTLDDRVVFITATCGFDGGYAQNQILQRTRACGIERGCMASLMNTDLYDFENAQGYEGRPWKQQEARRFCQKLTANLYQKQRPDALNHFKKKIQPLYEMLIEDSSDLSDLKNFPPHYLAALTPDERNLLASSCPSTQLAQKLARFRKQELELIDSFWKIVRATPNLIQTEKPEADINQLKIETEKLFDAYCPQKPNAGDFYPQLCFNGKTALLETLRATERFFSNGK